MKLKTKQIYTIIIVLFLADYFIWLWLDLLNYYNWSNELPEKLSHIYNEKEYLETMKYNKTKFSFWIISGLFMGIITLLALVFWWFWKLDKFVRKKVKTPVKQWILFFIILGLISTILNIPFSYYYTFVIEENFWFNKTDFSTFILDILKWTWIEILMTVIVFWILLKIYEKYWKKFIIIAGGFLVFFQIFMAMFSTSIFLPMFNELKPLENWELKQEIEKIAKNEWVKVEWIYTIDASKRSTKANAFFSGLWETKKIILYDNLIKDFKKDEIISVLYHEIWHNKLHHIWYWLAFWILELFLMLYLILVISNSKKVAKAMWTEQTSLWIWIVAFWMLTIPISLVSSLLGNSMSRHFEYQADNYSIERYNPEAMKNALIRLSKTTKSNVSPHPLYEIFYYSHPSILKRLENIDKFKKSVKIK